MIKKILITGATGNQGGAVLNALLASTSKKSDTWKIYALTRDVKSASAQKLETKGKGRVELVEGDLNNQEFLDSFMKPEMDLYAVFSVQVPNPAKGGVKAEMQQGIRLADAAKKANVKHFVYTSVGGAERNSGVPHFDSKFTIEEHIRLIKLPYTILRPVFFMDNFTVPGAFSKIVGAFYKHQMSPGRKLQLISVRDIGKFALLALENPNEYLGKEIEIAGDDLTYNEANIIWKKHMSGQDIPSTYSIATTILKYMVKELRTMFGWFEKSGYEADLPKLKEVHPDLWDFDTFLQKHKEE
ncbi:hypothetical protein INT44_001415 [Umbelopsis vinacea]|uniref:NmrA-like domain-containing protein n=1 Tax=Umbelopsis vinacea TaxID=44442 RepID=A0A8H7UMI0_9FUNG|nr:hypothetical protein INT44_001415 [Umbelopsis vinacea]